MRDTRKGVFGRGSAIASGVLLGLCAANAFAADGTLKLEQGLQWSEQGGGVCFNGDVGGGEFGVYDFVNNNASLSVLPQSAAAKVTATVNGIPGFDFQTFCLEPFGPIDFNVTLQWTASTTVQLETGATRNLDPRTAYLFTKFCMNQAFSPAYAYAPLGAGRSACAADVQLAIWYTEGESTFLGGNVGTYVADANAAVAAGGSWHTQWGGTFPGNLGGVRALNLVNGDSLQQDVLVVVPEDTPESECEGRTPGFWHNKNGQKLVKASGDGPEWSWLDTLNDLCLVNGSGADVDFTINKAGGDKLADFLVSGNNAVNMAQKLSQHVAAMQLNILNGFAHEDCGVFTGDEAECLDGQPETISLGELMDLAKDALCDANYTPEGHPDRDYQECLKNILDDANNNANWAD